MLQTVYVSLSYIMAAKNAGIDRRNYVTVTLCIGNDALLDFLSVFFHLFWKETFGANWCGFLRDECPSCQPTNSIKELKETQNTKK